MKGDTQTIFAFFSVSKNLTVETDLIKYEGGKVQFHKLEKYFFLLKNILICIVLVTGFKHIFWSIIVCVAMGCAAIFLYSNTIDFMNATVVTTVDTMTVPLSEVFFPSVVVCNINQVKTGILFHIFNVEYSNTSNIFSFSPGFN